MIIKKTYKNDDLRFDIDKYYDDLINTNIKRYKAIKYYADIITKINTYCDKSKKDLNNVDTNSLICELKYKFININLENHNVYDMINKILDEIKIHENLPIEEIKKIINN